MPRGFAAARNCPSSRATAETRPSDHGGVTVTSWPRARSSSTDVVAEALLDEQRARDELAREERRDQVLGVEVGRVDRLLQVQPAIDVVEEDVQRPLLLLVAAGRAVREPRLAAAQHEPRRERRPRPRARHERRREPLLEPEHLRARAERPAERRDRRRALEPAAGRRRREEVAEPVGDVEVHGVAARRLADAERQRVARRATASAAGRGRAAARPRPSSVTSLRRSSLYSAESSVSSGTGSASP